MSYSRFVLRGICISGVIALSACRSTPAVRSPAQAVAAPPIIVNPGDWPGYNRTLAGDRYSPLAEINAANVAGLRTICSYTLPEVTSLQTGPIVVNGTMFFTTDTISYAIDAGSCAEKWRTVRHSETPSGLGVNRGFAYMDGRLFRGTSDVHAIALDAADGHVVWDRVLDVKGPGVSIPMAPIAANGLVYIGNAGGDIAAITGHVYALDARDGHVVWKFDVVPSTGPARSTWPNIRLPVSGGAFWTSFTLDAPNAILYVPAGNPAPDFDVELRKGDNLYTNSVIALSSRSGRMLAWNQLVKRDAHDWDVDSPPALVTTRSGRRDRRFGEQGRSAFHPRSLESDTRPERSRHDAAARFSDTDDDATQRRRAAVERSPDALLSGNSGRQRVERRRLQSADQLVVRRRGRLVRQRAAQARHDERSDAGRGLLVRRPDSADADSGSAQYGEGLAHVVRRREWERALEIRGTASDVGGRDTYRREA